jgi:hypothetical protein
MAERVRVMGADITIMVIVGQNIWSILSLSMASKSVLGSLPLHAADIFRLWFH